MTEAAAQMRNPVSKCERILRPQKRPTKTEREPSSARSGCQRGAMTKPIPGGFCRRTRCEPRTARAPAVVSRYSSTIVTELKKHLHFPEPG